MCTEVQSYSSLDEGVSNFVDLIASAVQFMQGGPEIQLDISFEGCTSEDEESFSSIGTISSQFSSVSVFPNFNDGVPVAYALDVDRLRYLESQGLDTEDAIVWSKAFQYDAKSARTLAFYLSRRVSILEAEKRFL